MKTITISSHSHKPVDKSEGVFHFKPMVACIYLALVANSNAYAEVAVNALPTHGEVVAGQADISQQDAAMSITQSSDKAVIDWQTYNIGKDVRVDYHQPDSHSVALNRVISTDPSQIYGQLNANGQVYLVNPNGVLFAPGSKVDVGGIIASTQNISNEDFLAGKNQFERKGAQGAIVNQGEIKARNGGTVALLSPNVSNQGIIVAQQGDVVLAGGDKVTLQAGANGHLQIALEPNTIDSLIENKQLIKADGGQVIMTTSAASSLWSNVVSNTGSTEAKELSGQTGKIVLSADSQHGQVELGGLIDVSGQTAAGQILATAHTVTHSGEIRANSAEGVAGQVKLLGTTIQLQADSQIQADGATGGGNVQIGASKDNPENEVQASMITLAETAGISANAIQYGDGGRIILIADLNNHHSETHIDGSLSAWGGGLGGNGGFIETSAAILGVSGRARINTSALRGRQGTWLLDPYDLEISSSDNSNLTGNFTANADNSILNVNTLTSALASNNYVIVSTRGGSGNQAGNITVNADISWNTNNMLKLDAAGAIILNSTLSNNGSTSSLVLSAQGSGGISGAGRLINSGVLTLAVNNFYANGELSGVISGAGELTKLGNGNLRLSGHNTYTGDTNIIAGILSVGHGNALGDGGTVYMNGGWLQYSGISTDFSGRFSTTGAQRWNIDTNGQNVTFASVLSSSSSLSKFGNGSLKLSGNNTFSGGTIISGGTLIVDNNNSLGNGGIIYMTGGTLQYLGINADFSNRFSALDGQHWNIDTNGQIVTFASGLKGSSSLSKSGTGSLILSGHNTYTGGTNINAGTLEISGSGVLGGGHYLGSISNTGTFKYSSDSDQTLSGVFSGTGNLVKSSGLSTLTLSGYNSYSGDTTINAGTLEISGSGFLGGGNYRGSIFNNAALKYSSDMQQSLTGVISGAGSLVKAGIGSLTLSGDNTYLGDTFMSGGRLYVGHSNALGTEGTIYMNGGWLKYLSGISTDFSNRFSTAGGQQWNIDTNGQNVTFASVLSSSSSLSKSGDGSLMLSGSNTYTGDTYISFGTLIVDNSNALGNGHTINMNGGWLKYSLGISTDFSNRFSTAGAQRWNIDTNGQNVTFASDLIGSVSSLTKSGEGRLMLLGRAEYTGETYINAGTLEISGSGVLDVGNYGGPIYNTGTLKYSSDSDQTLRGVISGTGNLVKASSLSTLTLSGNNTYSGGTIISGGTLIVDNNNSLGNGGIIDMTGGTLQYSGINADFSNRFSIAGGQHWNIDTNGQNVTFASGLKGSSSLSKSGTGSLMLSGRADYTGDTNINAGTLEISGSGVLGGGHYLGSISNTGTFKYSSDSDQTLSGVFSGTGNLVKSSGLSTLTLSGYNSYSGDTTINAGTLEISGSGVLGEGHYLGSISNTGTLKYSSDSDQTLSGEISGTGSLVKSSSSSTLNLSGYNSYSGDITIDTGTLEISGLGTLSGSDYQGSIRNNGTLRYSSSRSNNISGVISGTGSLVIANDCLLDLSGHNTYSGGTTISAGMLIVSNSNALGTEGTIYMNGGWLKYSGVSSDFSNRFSTAGGQQWNIDTTDQDVTFTAGLSGIGSSLTKSGYGKLLLSGRNTYTGDTTIDSGALEISGSGFLGGGTYLGSISNNDTLIYSSDSDQILGGVISGTGNLVKAAHSSVLSLSGDNTYSGDTFIDAGTLQIGSASSSGSLGTGSVFNNSSLVFNRIADTTINNAISGSGSVLVTIAGNLTLGASASICSSANDIVLSASGHLINNAGNTVLSVTGNGKRWLVYSNDPVMNSFGGLNSGNTALWGTSYDAVSTPVNVGSSSGNRYIFAVSGGAVTVISTNLGKTYSDDPLSYSTLTNSITYRYSGVAFDTRYASYFISLAQDPASLFAVLPTVSSDGNSKYASAGEYGYNLNVGNTAVTGISVSGDTSAKFTVGKATLTVTGVDHDTTYNGSEQSNFGATYSGNAMSDSFNITGYATATRYSPTPYADNLSVSGSALDNYNVIYRNGSLSIGKATLTVTGVDHDTTYNGSEQSNFGATYSGNAMSDSFNITGYATATRYSPTPYADNLSVSGSALDNYNVIYRNGSLSIGKATLTVTGVDHDTTYNGSEQSNFGATYSGNKANDSFTISGFASGIDVGTYYDALNISGAAISNYNVETTNGLLRINAAIQKKNPVTRSIDTVFLEPRASVTSFSMCAEKSKQFVFCSAYHDLGM